MMAPNQALPPQVSFARVGVVEKINVRDNDAVELHFFFTETWLALNLSVHWTYVALMTGVNKFVLFKRFGMWRKGH